MSRIIYISPKTTIPAGGVKVIFQHVQGLRELGYDAYVGHPVDGYQPDWFEADIPIIYYLKGLEVFADDVFVVPETGYHTMRQLRGIKGRKVMFCQNWYGVPYGLGDARHWREFGIKTVLTCSNAVANCVREAFRIQDVHPVTCPIDHEVFLPLEKKRQIAYMPRKRPGDFQQILLNFELLAPHCDWSWAPIDNMPQQEVAKTLGESSVFLSLSRREGLGLPPLEAMASGCLVAGFHGIGGLEYARADNGLWCNEEDFLGCAKKLLTACEMFDDDADSAKEIVNNGAKTASNFNYALMKEDLDRFWSRFIGNLK